MKIIANKTNIGPFQCFILVTEEGEFDLSRQDLMDFVDTDVPLYLDDVQMSVNHYLGESDCFNTRVQNSDYSPY